MAPELSDTVTTLGEILVPGSDKVPSGEATEQLTHALLDVIRRKNFPLEEMWEK